MTKPAEAQRCQYSPSLVLPYKETFVEEASLTIIR